MSLLCKEVGIGYMLGDTVEGRTDESGCKGSKQKNGRMVSGTRLKLPGRPRGSIDEGTIKKSIAVSKGFSALAGADLRDRSV